MRKLLRLRCVSALVTTTLFSAAYAEEQILTTSLDSITVYATRSAQSTFDVPAIVSTIDPTKAGNATASDIGDLFEFTPGVEVDNGPRRNGQTISIRGFDDEAVITLIDGRRQNFESAHDGRFFVDPSLLKRVEIVKGASSAIYGGGAIGGVVAFETKDAADFLAPGETHGLYTSLGARSANDELSSVVTSFARVSNWDFLASVNYRDSGDIEQGNGDELDTEDELLSGLFKASYIFNDFHEIKLQAQLLNNDGQEPNNGAGGITSSNPLVDKEVKDNQYSIKYAYTDPDSAWISTKLHLYYNDSEVEERDIIGSSNAGRVQVRELETLGFTIDNQTKFQISEDQQHILSYGFEIYNDEQKGQNSFIGSRAGVPDAEATNYGFYLQDEIAVNTSVGDFLIIPAARFDQYKSDDISGNSQDENELSPKLSASFKPNQDVVLFGSWAQAFRAPNLTELYPSGQHFPGVSFCPAPIPGCPPVPLVTVFPNNNFIANPDLKPETVTTIEFGAGLNFDQVLSKNDHLRIKGSVYESQGDDFINQGVNTAAGTTRNFNVSNAVLRGWELESQYALGKLNARIGMSYLKATNDDTGEYLSNNVPLTLVTDVNYKLDSIAGILGWRGRFSEKNDRVGDDDDVTGGYGVHDLYYRWAPTAPHLQDLTFDVGVENVFDKAYTKRFITLFEEGRSYVARVSYQW
jgi:hemoglobin/transferrin/lactoferrin receptor protein